MDKNTHPYHVPDDTAGSRQETAALLVGTADEYGISQREVFAVPSGGFRISEAVFNALGWGDDEDPTEGTVTEGQDTSTANVVGQGIPVTAPAEEGEDVDIEALAQEGEVRPDYAAWDRADLLTAVSNRGLETEDKKTATLIAALEADDESVAAEDDQSTED